MGQRAYCESARKSWYLRRTLKVLFSTFQETGAADGISLEQSLHSGRAEVVIVADLCSRVYKNGGGGERDWRVRPIAYTDRACNNLA